MKDSLDPKEQIIRLLNQEFQRLRSKNSRFSLRSLARRLDVSPAALSGIMSGKLNLTKRMGMRLLNFTQIEPTKSEALLKNLTNKQKRSRPRSTADAHYVLLDMKDYRLIADWFYFAILSLVETKEFQGNESWVAKRLGIQKRQAKIALVRLERMGLIARDEKGRLRGTGKPFRTSSGIPNADLRYSHGQNLKLAEKSLKNDKLDDCDFSAMTVAIHPKHIKEAKGMLREFRRKFADRIERGEKTEVYRLCIQFFPLTHLKNAQRRS